jgi:hypothetical protein
LRCRAMYGEAVARDVAVSLQDAISLKYTRKPFPFRSPEGSVRLVIDFEKVRYTKLPF